MDADQIMSQAEQSEVDDYHAYLDKMAERDREYMEMKFQMLSEVKPLTSWREFNE
tara:strand:- start:868 stop:1032 length:165 start_codon:yes stop_codon:yes gene_type:complete